MPILIIIFLILAALALPMGLRKKSWLWFFAGIILSFLIIILPLFIFSFSGFLLPEWKGDCAHGWVDCFIEGKLALSPIVLWATSALYAVEILRVKRPAAKWIVLGIFLGAITATVCLVHGLALLGWQNRENDFSAWLLVPAYVAVWYSIRAVQLMKAAKFSVLNYFWAFLGSLPFWLASYIWSKNIFESLPNQEPQGCFIVTAAGRGHRKIVGPFFEVKRGGQIFLANQQLITLWQFENIWRNRSPRSHRNFRRLYNRFGPLVASKIKSPWLADLTFASLKPVEIVARLINQKLGDHF